MMKYFIPTAIFFAVLAVGCAKFEEQPLIPEEQPCQGRKVTAGLVLGVAPELDEQGREIPITRAPNDFTYAEESAIRNVWIFQFGEPVTAGNDDSRLLIRSCYIDETTIDNAGSGTGVIPVDLIESGSQKHLLVFVANTNNGGYNWSMTVAKSTYGDLKSSNYLLRSDTEDSILYGDDLRNIIMSGAAEVTVAEGLIIDSDTDNPAQDAGIMLTRSLAKIRLELALGNPDYKVLSVKLRDMPDRLWFTDVLNTHTELEPAYPSLIDFPIADNIENGLVDYGDTETFVWYVPRHTRGTNPNVDQAQNKNIYAPTWATYIEIMAVHATNGTGVVYRIYPGADITDFNIIPNHRYLIKQTITGNGGENLTDSRIEQFGRNVRLSGKANSFIINPPTSEGMGARTYEIPITRVNEYWEPNAQSNPGYGGLNEGIIGSSIRWRVDLLWQDDSDMVRETSDEESRIWISKAEGKGPDDCFSVTVPYGATHGNFVMALRYYDPDSSPYEDLQALVDQVLWSWHFWVTDYNPDRLKFIAVRGDKFTYPVSGGQVERYGGSLWGYDTDGAALSNNWNNYAYNEASTQPYAKAFMMDRNIGAVSTAYTGASAKGNITYQFGRKDPLPGDIALYNVKGSAIASTPASGFQAQRWSSSTANGASSDVAVKVSESVNNPMKFYSRYNANWTSNANGYSTTILDAYAWNDPMVPTGPSSAVTDYQGKSIYDPCPEGWKLPVNSVWQDFRRNGTYGWTVNNGEHGRGDSFGSFDNGIRYWPNVIVNGEAHVNGKISYPAAGARRTGSSVHGSVYRDGTYCYVWTATPSSTGLASHMYTNSTSFSVSGTGRSFGMSVRCVSMDE